MTDTKHVPKSNPILPKVWITKYALTKGVHTAVNVEQCLSTVPDGSMIAVPQARYSDAYFHKPDWHTTPEDAQAQVQKMIASERKSLAKKLAKLEALEKALGDFDSLPTIPWGQ